MTNKKKEALFIALSILMYVIVFIAGIVSGYMTARHDYMVYTCVQQLEKKYPNEMKKMENQ